MNYKHGPNRISRVYAALLLLTEEKGYPPSIREITEATGISGQVVYSDLERLCEVGRVKKSETRNKARTHTVVGERGPGFTLIRKEADSE